MTVVVEAAKPVEQLTLPREAVLSDQRGDFVYVVGAEDKVERRAVQLGQSTPETAVISGGLKEGERVVLEGMQRVQPGMQVAPAPAIRARAPLMRCQPAGAETMFSATFIDRPRLAIVIAIVTTIAGVLALMRIPVAQLPDIVPPQVSVTAVYPGASAEVVESTVAQPLESKVIGVDKMLYMKSTGGNDGSYTLTVSFELGTDPDINTVNVNNRVQTALSQLPQEVQLQGVTVQKKSSSLLQFLAMYSDSGEYDQLFLTNLAVINVLDELSRTPGVGQASIFGRQKYSMRIWFDTDRLVSLNLAPSDIIKAIQAQNIQAPVGRLGARPVPDDQRLQLNLQTQGRLTSSEQFGEIVLRANPDGSVLRVRDVARVEMGAESEDTFARINGKPAVGIGIYLSPGANAVNTAKAVARDPGKGQASPPRRRDAPRHLRFDHLRQRDDRGRACTPCSRPS